MPADRIPLVGIVGGIASGKSYVSEQLKRKGAAVIVADQLAHEVLKLDEVKQLVRSRFGPEVFGADGEVDRGRLASLVFANSEEGSTARGDLERITHPRIGALVRQRIEKLRAEG